MFSPHGDGKTFGGKMHFDKCLFPVRLCCTKKSSFVICLWGLFVSWDTLESFCFVSKFVGTIHKLRHFRKLLDCKFVISFAIPKDSSGEQKILIFEITKL